MYRKTYLEVNLDHIAHNVKVIKERYPEYQYYIAMVKGNAYGHGMYIVNTLVEAGINYLAVSSLDEAIEIRKYHKEIPILCTEIIDEDCLEEAIQGHITLTVDNLEFLKKLEGKNCKVHIKLNTGMNRIGVSSREEFNQICEYVSAHKNITLEGIYTHFGTPGVHDIYFDRQISRFQEITMDADLTKIPMVHLSSSFILLAHPKIEFANAVRFGTILYGYDISLREYGSGFKEKMKKIRDKYLAKKNHISPVIRGDGIDLKPAISLKTNVMEIRNVKAGELLGYGVNVVAEDMKIAVLPAGYDDGIGTNMEDRHVLIHGKKYEAVGQIEMCMMFVKVDDSVNVGDTVTLMGDELTLGYMSRLKNAGIQETLVSFSKSLSHVYVKNNQIEEIISYNEKEI